MSPLSLDIKPSDNYLFIICDRITYNLWRIMNCKQGLQSGTQTEVRGLIETEF